VAKYKPIDENEILRLSLIGLGQQLANTNAAITGIRSRLGIRGPRRSAVETDGTRPAPTKRRISAAARKRMSEATRLRWKNYRKARAVAEKPAAKPKRKLSKAGRAAIIAATKKRWAAVHKAQRAATKMPARAAAKKTATKKTRKTAVKSPPTPVAAAPVTT
jgi:hypothetical protein